MATNSAGVNFGKPNEEFIIESDGSGALTSARNAVTGDEYIGGGGDFSTFNINLISNADNVIVLGAFTFEDEGVKEFDIWVELYDGDEIPAKVSGIENTVYIYSSTAAGNTTGNITYIGDQTFPFGIYKRYEITGDCSITFGLG